MSTTHVNGFDMYFEDRGAGEPLLLLHGGMGIGADWLHVFPEDPDGYRAIVPDLRGHGRSTNPSGAFTFRQCAQDVLALLDHLGVPSAKAIGMSMGAKTLLHVATARPSVVSAMVLVSATPYFPPSLRTAAAQFTQDALDGLTDAERAALRARHVHGDAQIAGLYEMTRGFATSYDDLAFTPPQLGTIAARTLIVHGDRDPLYPVELGVDLYRAIPHSALWVVPYGTHGPVFGPIAGSFRAAALAHLSKTGQE
jgi:pimeloyl-ACP methyl ester carboxylesterase